MSDDEITTYFDIMDICKIENWNEIR